MALIFLSYRRTDSPQACRVYDWFTRRFGEDSVFMDVEDIVVAEDFIDRIRNAILSSGTLIALIGPSWQQRINEPNDPVRMEVETAVSNSIPVIPVLIGNTQMPDPEQLPPSIAIIARQNAIAVGVSRDFDRHMQLLQPRVESILQALSKDSIVTNDPTVVSAVFQGIIRHLKHSHQRENPNSSVEWKQVNAEGLRVAGGSQGVSLLLHRYMELVELIELHFIVTFWGGNATAQLELVGWVSQELKRLPWIHSKEFWLSSEPPPWEFRLRLSDEDPRELWKMISSEPYHLSLSYVATISPKSDKSPQSVDTTGTLTD